MNPTCLNNVGFFDLQRSSPRGHKGFYVVIPVKKNHKFSGHFFNMCKGTSHFFPELFIDIPSDIEFLL